MSRTPHELPLHLELGGREEFHRRFGWMEFVVGEPGVVIEELFGGVGVSRPEAAVVWFSSEPCGGGVEEGGEAGGMSGDGATVAYPLFQEGGDSNPTTPLQFNIYEISVERAVELNKRWHSKLPDITNPYGDQICFGAEYNGRLYACAIWTMPVARLFNGKNYLELRRMAISADAPKNTASRMMSMMVKIIRKAKPHIVKLISYQDTEVHSGTIYKASGWQVAQKTQGGSSCPNSVQSWQRCKRHRKESQSTAFKIRWEKNLK